MSQLRKIDPYTVSIGTLSNFVQWNIDPLRAVLLFHDMQKYFLRPFSETHSPASELIKNVARLHSACAELGIPIAYTAQPGDMNTKQRGLLKDFWGPGMKATPEDRQIIESISPRSIDWMFTKWRYSAFVRTDFLERMNAEGRDQLIICGVYAHVGILSTAIDAFSNDIQPFVVSDATADFTSEDHWMALNYISRRCGAVVTSDEVLNCLEKNNGI